MATITTWWAILIVFVLASDFLRSSNKIHLIVMLV